MGHKNKSYRAEADKRLKSMLCIGQSKHGDKIAGRDRTEKIYSWETYHNYRKWIDKFLNYCKEKGKPSTLESCKIYIDGWLQGMVDRGLSAWTVHLARSAVAKLYGCKASDFLQLPPRRRADIVRSREPVEMDKRIKADLNPLIEFCKGTGLRRHELIKLCGTDLHYIDGCPFITVKGKGGRIRDAPIIGDHTQAIVERLISCGGGIVWDAVPSKMDIHGLRAEYAAAIYAAHARPLDSLPRKELYFCRNDKRGAIYDRAALLAASRALGHSRVSVVAVNYLWINK